MIRRCRRSGRRPGVAASGPEGSARPSASIAFDALAAGAATKQRRAPKTPLGARLHDDPDLWPPHGGLWSAVHLATVTRIVAPPQPPATSGRRGGIATSNWFDLDEDHGVLEFHEYLTGGVGLELHLVHTPHWGWLAWWERDDGAWLGMARIGAA